MTAEPATAVGTRQRRRQWWAEALAVAAIALLLIALLPPLLSEFTRNNLGRFLALAIAALGLDLIWGFAGLLSLGQGIFFALGGYALAMHLKLASADGLPEFFTLYGVSELPWFWQPFHSLPFAAIAVFAVPALLAGGLGWLVFRNRIRGVYFTILTQAALLVFFNFFNGQQELINGTNGLKTATTELFGRSVGSSPMQLGFYALTVLLLAAAYALCRWLTSGRFGRLLVALRDDERRVRFSGYNPTGFQVLVFAIAGGLAGVGGALYTVQSGIISPSAMEIPFSIEMAIWVAVGGRATLVGAIVGAVAVNLAKTLLSEQLPAVWIFFQGSLFLLVVTVLPQGVVGWLRVEGPNRLRQLLGRSRVETYPQLEQDPEVKRERQDLER